MASEMYPFINYQDNIHYRNSCSATIMIVKFLLLLSTRHDTLARDMIPSLLVFLFVSPSCSSYHDWSPLHSSLTADVIPYHPYVAAVTIVIYCVTLKYYVLLSLL